MYEIEEEEYERKRKSYKTLNTVRRKPKKRLKEISTCENEDRRRDTKIEIDR